MDFDFSTIIYIIIAILFSLFSGKKMADKNKRREVEEEEYDAPETSLEEEIRKMAERMTGKRTEASKPEPKPEPEYKSQETKKEYSSPYKTYDRKTNYDRDLEPLERIPTEPVTDYSVSDVEALRKYNESIKSQKYEANVTNLEKRSIDSLAKGKELHTVMDEEDDDSVMTVIDERFDYSNFDARKAFIYSEIFNRPKY